MRDFFVNQWLNFKQKWHWYIVFLFVSLFTTFSCIGFIDNFCYYLVSKTFFESNLVFYEYTALFSLFFFILFRALASFELYILSYHIYTGKRNWYKFFREREKMHKKEDSNSYKEYLNSQKSE